MSHYVADTAAADYAYKSGYHKAVIQNILADSSSSRTVEPDTSQVWRIGRQEEVTVTRADKRH